MTDNWKHRSSGMICDTCIYYVPKVLRSNEESKIGRCRRNAPTMKGWPALYATDWCGDHKINEEKV